MNDFTGYTKGDALTITTRKGDSLTGTFVSVNSKGVNIKVDDKTRSVSLTNIADVTTPNTDGYTTAALAAIFDTERKVLRVTLRKLGLGVGKGRRYHLDLTDDLRTAIKTDLAS